MRERPLPRKSTPPCAVWSFTSFRKLTILSVIVVLNSRLGTDCVAATAAGGERALLHALQHGLYHSSNATHVDELITSLEKVIWHSRRILKSGNFQEHHVAHTKLEHANLTQASDLTSWARAATAWLGAAMRLQAGDAAAATQQGGGIFGGVAARVSHARDSHRRRRRHLSSSENVFSTREDDGAEVVGDDGGDSSASRPRQRRVLHGTPAAQPQLAAARVLSAESASAAAGRLLHSSDDSSSGPDAGSSTGGNNSSATSTTAAATPTTQLPVILSFTPEQERLRQGYRQRAGELAPSPWPAQQLTLLVPVMRRLLLAQLLKAWLRDMRQQLPAEPQAAQALAVLIRKVRAEAKGLTVTCWAAPTVPSMRAHLFDVCFAKRFIPGLASPRHPLPATQLFEVHVGSVVQRAALEYFHISKAGGTSWTVAASEWAGRGRQDVCGAWESTRVAG